MISQPIVIDTSSSGNLTVVTPPSGYSIYVTEFYLVVGGITNVKFTDGAGGTNLSGTMSFAANGGIVVNHTESNKRNEYWFKTTKGTALVMNNSQAQQVGGVLRYYMDTA